MNLPTIPIAVYITTTKHRLVGRWLVAAVPQKGATIKLLNGEFHGRWTVSDVVYNLDLDDADAPEILIFLEKDQQ